MQTRVTTGDVGLEGTTLIAGVLEGLDPVPGSERDLSLLDETALQAAGFEGKPGELLVFPHPEAKALLLIGLGEEVSYDAVRSASGNAIRKVRTERAVSLLGRVGIDGATRAVTEGSLLGAYDFVPYKSAGSGLPARVLEIADGEEDEHAVGVVMAEATAMARDWVNTPAKDKSPEAFAELITGVAGEAGVDAEVWDRGRIEQEGLGALLGVAAGSDRDPRVVFLTYRPGDAVKHLALVGKGIMFDSGGLSLKTPKAMEEMKNDMGGAAAVLSATMGIARLGLPVTVTAVAPLTDNVVGGDATRPGDVLRPVDGPSIEVLNTDAEGRLILADGLSLAKRFEPDLTIDVATLTGSAVVGLGRRVGALYGSDSEVAELLLRAASRAGEEFWEMPLFREYRKLLDSNVADIKNSSGSRYGGSIVAALFLAEYAGDGPWAHLDIAGPALSQETTGEIVKGATGVSVRTLIELARGFVETG